MPRKKRDFTPLPGFPISEPFKCMEEVDAYLSGNLIQCRQCGHHFRGLARHITKQHEISADEYKEAHGIPWLRGLTSGSLHNELRQLAYDLDTVAKVAGKYGTKKGQKLKPRGYCIARRNGKMTYTEEQYYAAARRVAAGEALLAVCRDPGMPSTDAVRAYRQFNREYDAFFREQVEPNLLPWRASERKNLNDGRVQIAIKMASDGATAKEIAAATGYTVGNAYVFLKGKNWKPIREGTKPVVRDPTPSIRAARMRRAGQ